MKNEKKIHKSNGNHIIKIPSKNFNTNYTTFLMSLFGENKKKILAHKM